MENDLKNLKVEHIKEKKDDLIDKNSLTKYQFIIDNINDLISILNQNLEYEYINEQGFMNILGYLQHEIIGKPLTFLIHPDDIEYSKKIIMEGKKSNKTTQQIRFRNKKGDYLSFEVKTSIFKDIDENVKHLMISREISDSKLIEQNLKEYKGRYRKITENLNDLIHILNKDFEFEYVNEDVALKLIGYDNKDLIGKSILNFIHPDDIEPALKILKRGFEADKAISELRFKHKDEHWIWFEWKGKTYYNRKGDLKRLIISRNISEQKLAEEKYRNIFENSPNAIILVNFNGVIVDSNDTSKKLFGYDKEDLIKKNINELTKIFPQENKNLFKRMIKTFFKGEVPETKELQIKKKDGNFIWVNLQTSLFKIEGNTLIQFIFLDTTEKKKAEVLENQFKEQLENEVQARTKELNNALEQQKLYLDHILKSSQFKTEFMSTMSHELRTPLNAIIGFTDLLIEGACGPLNEKQLEYLNDIKTSAEHQFDMIKHILDISRIEAGQMILNLQNFSLNNIVNQIKSSMRPLYNKKGLKFKIKGLETENEIYADPIRFKEILLNLVSNAIKFTISGKIILSVQEKYDHWLFKVKDTGIGIARKNFDLIFKDFKRVQDAYVQSIPGTGLGLSLTKRLVNLHGGEISFSSVLGVGTTFTFTIPKKNKISL